MTAQPRQPEAAAVPSAGDGQRQPANRVIKGIIWLA
jgi:hypothetical protein